MSREATPKELVLARAKELGFDAIGVASATEPLGIEHDRYVAFVARGAHGEMAYLAENAEARRRLDTDHILLGAKSVICVGRRYARPAADEANDPELSRGVARYARGHDYHNFVRRKLRRLAAYVRTLAPGVTARPLCDVEPVLERVWATRAGLGFVGKNGLLITPGQGSYQLLGEVVTTLDLPADAPIAERCGSCTRCLDACPTRAFTAPFVLDPTRCVAYLTIEAEAIPPAALREAMGEHLFGCDVCQEVCPFNATAPPPIAKTSSFRPHDRAGGVGLDDLVAMDEAAWVPFAEGSPLRRPGRGGIARNAVIVAQNRLLAGRGGERERRAVAIAKQHDDPRVRAVANAGTETPLTSVGSEEGDP